MKNFKKQAQHLESFKHQMDSMSADIRNIQQFLRDFGVSLPIHFFCLTYNEFQGEDIGDLGRHGIEMHFDEYLVWEHAESGNKPEWYLFYEKQEQEGYIESDGFCVIQRYKIGASKTLVKKRLIETEIETRFKMYSFLDGFLDEVCKRCKIDAFQTIHANLQDKMEKMNSCVKRISGVTSPYRDK